MASLSYWIWLTTRRGFKTADYATLLQKFGTPEKVYFSTSADYERQGYRGTRYKSLLDKDLSGAQQIMEDCAHLGLDIITIQDARYPERLKEIYDPPCVLYVKGRLPTIDEYVAVGVVGSREPTPYGVEMAQQLGRELSRNGAIVVSGLAQGIDAQAIYGALQGGGAPISVLGGGVDIVYPSKNRQLYEDVAAMGALVSEYPPGTPHEKSHFPVRNRIISGLSLGIVAVEAAAVRSGTLITTRLALEQDRDVFAYPGPANAPMSTGTNRLIQRGEAKMVLSAEDVLEEYRGVYPMHLIEREPLPPKPIRERSATPKTDRSVEPEEKLEVDTGAKARYITLSEGRSRFTDDQLVILRALEKASMGADELVEVTGLATKAVLSALTMLQIQGGITDVGNKQFSTDIVIAG